GVGSTPAAEAVARRLIAAGFTPADVQVIGPNERKKNLVARLHGKGAGKPILLLAHLDVVEARREDWSPDLDPFQFVERDGYFYSKNGKPYSATLAAAEKKATTLQLQTINRGGHGSLPRRDNAIYELTAALQRLANFQFPPMLSEVTRTQFAAMARLESGQL